MRPGDTGLALAVFLSGRASLHGWNLVCPCIVLSSLQALNQGEMDAHGTDLQRGLQLAPAAQGPSSWAEAPMRGVLLPTAAVAAAAASWMLSWRLGWAR